MNGAVLTTWDWLLLWGAVRVTGVAAAAALACLLLGRAGARTRQAVCLAGLIVCAALLPAAVLPGPRWELGARTERSRAADAPLMAASSVPAKPASVGAGAGSGSGKARETDPADDGVAAAAWGGFVEALRHPKAVPRVTKTPAARPWNWVAWAVFGAVAVGLTRLAAGAWLVGRCVRRSRPVGDPAMGELLDELKAELRCTADVALRQSREMATAAAAGWRRFVVLLPGDWESWTAAQRRAVLAHELAHVRRRDTRTGGLAQLALAVNFYHPLAHWLAGRLRLEQELAADALAATAAGGRTAYLRALAELSLRRPAGRVSWPARAFLPTRGTFLRRIEMLRDPRTTADAPAPLLRATGVAGLLLLGVVLAGIGPGWAVAQSNRAEGPRAYGATPPRPGRTAGDAGATVVRTGPSPTENGGGATFEVLPPPAGEPGDGFRRVADPKTADQKPAAPSLLAYVPDDALAAVVLRPRDLMNDKRLAPAAAELDALLKDSPDAKWQALIAAGVTPGNIEQLAAGMTYTPATVQGGPGGAMQNAPAVPAKSAFGVAIRTVKPIRREELADAFGEARPVLGGVIYGDDSPLMLIDDTTLILGSGVETVSAMALNGQLRRAESVWDELHEQLGSPQAAVFGSVARGVVVLRQNMQRDFQGMPPQLAPLMPLLDGIDSAGLGLKLESGLSLRGVAQCPDLDRAERVADTLRALSTLAGNTVRQSRQSGVGGDELKPLLGLGESLLDSVKIDVPNVEKPAEARTPWDMEGRPIPARVTLAATADGDAGAAALAMLVPALKQARASARRTQSTNNLKQIALACHIYADARENKFPPAVIEENGVKRSWRVELLPYFGQQELYDAYRKNEPWDSEHNKTLLAKIPPIYRDPSDTTSDPTATSYFALTGPETIFPGATGTAFSSITDGMSNTLLVVEARRNVPWTKPEDIPFDPTKSAEVLKSLGGNHPGGFLAATADGAVRFVSSTLDPDSFKALVTRAGGEVVGPLDGP